METVVVLVFIVVFLCSLWILSRPKAVPPGPLTLPLVGSYFFLNDMRKKKTHVAFFEASKRYGRIFSYRIGSQLIVVLHGYEAIYKALVKQADIFSDRPTHTPAFKRRYKNGPEGIAFNGYNHSWKFLRRFTLQTLRDFGVGKSSIEDKIMAEIDAAAQALEKTNSKPFEITSVLQKVVGNVIYGIIFGKRFEYDDPDFEMVQRLSSIAVSGQGITSVVNFFPLWVTAIFARKENKEAAFRRENMMKIRKFIFDQIKEHQDSFDGQNIRDFVDLYIQATRDSNEEVTSVLTENNVFSVIVELFLAGAESTYNSLDWAFLFMTEYPEIQTKCQQEIENTVGDRKIKYSDRLSLKYIDATVMEIQRVANVIPMALHHNAMADTTLMGYTIPKDTVMLPILIAANMDPDYWKNPEKFDPERFLNKEGNIIKNEAMIPFSVGPRTCLGEPLARMELFLVFANLLQKFRFERENLNVRHPMDLKPNQVASAPSTYKLVAKRR